MNEVVSPIAELDDQVACYLMVLYNFGDWLTVSDWATVVATTVNGYDYHDCDRVEPTSDDIEAIKEMITSLLATGLIHEVDGQYIATPRARAELATHGLGFGLRKGGLNVEDHWSSNVIGQRVPAAA